MTVRHGRATAGTSPCKARAARAFRNKRSAPTSLWRTGRSARADGRENRPRLRCDWCLRVAPDGGGVARIWSGKSSLEHQRELASRRLRQGRTLSSSLGLNSNRSCHREKGCACSGYRCRGTCTRSSRCVKRWSVSRVRTVSRSAISSCPASSSNITALNRRTVVECPPTPEFSEPWPCCRKEILPTTDDGQATLPHGGYRCRSAPRSHPSSYSKFQRLTAAIGEDPGM